VGCSEYGNEPLGSMKGGSSLISRATVSFSRKALLNGVS